jgi:hypothetical protein
MRLSLTADMQVATIGGDSAALALAWVVGLF